MDELVNDYIVACYQFTSNIDGWCVYDKHLRVHMSLRRMMLDTRKVFPDVNSGVICTKWWVKNKEITENKINNYLSKFQLKETDGPMLWRVETSYRNPFVINGLFDILPQHHSHDAILKIFNDWFEEQKLMKTEEKINGYERNN